MPYLEKLIYPFKLLTVGLHELYVQLGRPSHIAGTDAKDRTLLQGSAHRTPSSKSLDAEDLGVDLRQSREHHPRPKRRRVDTYARWDTSRMPLFASTPQASSR